MRLPSNPHPPPCSLSAASHVQACAPAPHWGHARFLLDLGAGYKLEAERHLALPPLPPLPPRPPAPPPATPPVTQHLTQYTCDRMLADPHSLFRKMWGVQARRQGRHSQPSCFDVARAHWGQRVSSANSFHDIEQGVHCHENWYADSHQNSGDFGDRGDAPALLGHDTDIYNACGRGDCDRAGYNILQLRPTSSAFANGAVEWNTCRNFEWQVCAARGRLPRQGSRAIVFATAPHELWLDGSHGSTKFGACRGYALQTGRSGQCNPATDFANGDVFFLEVCVFAKICSNAAELFRLNRGDMFQCEYSPEGFERLKALLVEGPAPERKAP